MSKFWAPQTGVYVCMGGVHVFVLGCRWRLWANVVYILFLLNLEFYDSELWLASKTLGSACQLLLSTGITYVP